MTLNVDKYLSWKFDIKTCNCWHLAKAAWYDVTGMIVDDYTPERTSRTDLWLAATEAQTRFMEIPKAESPCLVLMQRAQAIPHIGVFYQRRVLHMTPKGVSYQPLEVATASFPVVLFYKNKA